MCIGVRGWGGREPQDRTVIQSLFRNEYSQVILNKTLIKPGMRQPVTSTHLVSRS